MHKLYGLLHRAGVLNVAQIDELKVLELLLRVLELILDVKLKYSLGVVLDSTHV